MDESFAAEIQQFLVEPSAERFLSLRDAVSESPGYLPYSSDLTKGHELLTEGRFEEAKSYLLSLAPGWILNPGMHRLLSVACYQLGQVQIAMLEHEMAMAMLNGILSTGDGSEARPYLVLHVADEYDVLNHLEKRSQGQALVQKGERYCDLRTCDDGSEIWFDVTVPLAHLRKRVSGVT